MHQLPNILSILRLLASIPLAMLVLERLFPEALVLLILVGVTDVVDGALARWFGWTSRLGTVLDPVADKVVLSLFVLSLSWIGLVPWQFVVILLTRELLMIFGGLYMQITASSLGKYSTLTLYGYLTLVLLLQILPRYAMDIQLMQGLEMALMPMCWLSAITVLATGLHYLYLLNRHLLSTST